MTIKLIDKSLATIIADKASQLGFAQTGFARLPLPAHYGQGLMQFLDKGYHGDMDWLEARARQRLSPEQLWPDAKSALVFTVNYGPDFNPLDGLAYKERAVISAYAQNLDYHDVIKKQLRPLARWLSESAACQVKIFVDTAPLMEKPLAVEAGLGWQGKHSNFLNREYGNWLFLAVILTDRKLADDVIAKPYDQHCGSCTSCLDICPTQAFDAAGKLDARRCISYLTIEHKTMIPRELRAAMGNHIYGCDDCLAICPWNKFATPTQRLEFLPVRDLLPRLDSLLGLTRDEDFRAFFRKSPVKRIGRARFLRNLLIALANYGEASLLPKIMPLIDDESPLVRAACYWALSQLMAGDEWQKFRLSQQAIEADNMARAELT